MFSSLLNKLLKHHDLSEEEAAEAMAEIMAGKAAPAQIGALLIGLAMKGERPDEIVGLAKTMRLNAVKLTGSRSNVFDTCGTGGDQSNTFNVSSVAALVVAGSEFRFEQSAGVLQGHVALACQDAQRQIGAMLQLLHALLQLHSLEHFPAAAGGILLHALGQDLDDIAQDLGLRIRIRSQRHVEGDALDEQNIAYLLGLDRRRAVLLGGDAHLADRGDGVDFRQLRVVLH